MRHVFIVDPLSGLSVTRDTSVVFMREAARRGQEVFTVEPGFLAVEEGSRAVGRVRPTKIGDGEPWYELGPPISAPLDEFDVVWMRQDPPFDMNYFWLTHLLSLAARRTLVVNDPRGLREVDEKMFSLRYPDIIPPTLVSRSIAELLAFREKLGGEMVIKPLGGCGGEAVFHLTAGDRNARALLELATDHETRYQVGQRYLPEIREGDKRIILVDGEPLGAVLRVPRNDESRANFHVGGSALRVELTARDREICERIRPGLLKNGIVFAGIDVIGGWLIEVNVTSPTGIQEINALDGVALEGAVLDAVERRVAERRQVGDGH